MSYNLVFNKLECRGAMSGKTPEYIVRGYASVPDVPYSYKYNSDSNGKPINSLKEMFTKKGINSLKKKMKSRKVYVDAEHKIGASFNAKSIISKLKNKASLTISKDLDEIESYFDFKDLPLAKVREVNIDDKGLFVETALNPYYAEQSPEHKKYFDAVWGSLKNGFINGFSVNYKPTEVIPGEIPKIDDVDIYGLSYTGGASHHEANITEVLMRSAVNVLEGKNMTEGEQPKEQPEGQPDPKSEPKVQNNSELDAMRQKLEEATSKLQSYEKEKEKAELKSEWEKEAQSLKDQLAELNSKLEAQSNQSTPPKSTVNQNQKYEPPKPKDDEVVEKINKVLPDPEKTPDVFANRIHRYAYYKNPSTRSIPIQRLGEGIDLQGQFFIPQSKSMLKEKKDVILTKVS